MKAICPGQDMRFWKPQDIFDVACAKCGQAVEMFKDDVYRHCTSCGSRIANPKLNLGCAQWCQHAKECLGFDPKEAAQGAKAEQASLADRLIEAVKRQFGEDRRRIVHALAVHDRARDLLKREPGDPRVVIAAALLHDIGIQEAERKHGSADARHQEAEGPPIARRILEGLSVDGATIEQVCRIVGSHHSGQDIDTPESRIVWDADWLVILPEGLGEAGPAAVREKIGTVFRTPTGRELAKRIYLEKPAKTAVAG